MQLSNSNNSIPKIKYFKDMLFLKPFVLSECNKNKAIESKVNNDSNKKQNNTFIDITDNQDDCASDVTVEFSISQNDLDELDDMEDNKDGIFVELSDTEDDVSPNKQLTQPPKVSDVIQKNTQENEISATTETKMPSEEITNKDTPAPAVATKPESISQNTSDKPCEDRIFGDLVTVMLMKLNDQEKRIAKRKIMEILL